MTSMSDCLHREIVTVYTVVNGHTHIQWKCRACGKPFIPKGSYQ